MESSAKNTEYQYNLHDDPRFSSLQSPWFTHEYITYFSCLPLWIMKLAPIKIQANPNFQDWEVGPNHHDLFRENPIKSNNRHPIALEDGIACDQRNGEFSHTPPDSISIEPWKILTLYSTEPDWDLDVDLDLHWKQKLTKGSHGYRHMQYNLFGFQFGKTLDTFMYHFYAAQRAWTLQNPYWTWRFLSRGTHYLADLGAPFHVKVFPYREFPRILISGKKAFQIAASMHNSHEVFTQHRFRTHFEPFKITLIQGASAGSQLPIQNEGEFIKYITTYRKQASKLLSPMYYTLWNAFGKDILEVLQVDHESTVDSSKQLAATEIEVRKILFADLSHPALKTLDTLTSQALFECGKSIGIMLRLIKNNLSL